VADTGVAAAFCGRFAATFFVAFREAFTGAFFVAVFLAARFLATVEVSAFFAAWNAAQRFFVASTMAFLPAALSFRFGLGAFGATGDEVFLDSAHLLELPAWRLGPWGCRSAFCGVRQFERRYGAFVVQSPRRRQ